MPSILKSHYPDMKNRLDQRGEISLNPPLRVLSTALGRRYAPEETLTFPRPPLKRSVTRERIERYFAKQGFGMRSQLD